MVISPWPPSKFLKHSHFWRGIVSELPGVISRHTTWRRCNSETCAFYMSRAKGQENIGKCVRLCTIANIIRENAKIQLSRKLETRFVQHKHATTQKHKNTTTQHNHAKTQTHKRRKTQTRKRTKTQPHNTIPQKHKHKHKNKNTIPHKKQTQRQKRKHKKHKNNATATFDHNWNVQYNARSVRQSTLRILQSTTQHYSVQHSTTPYYKVLHSTSPYYKDLQSTTQYYSALQSTTPVLLCTTKYYSTLYYKVLLYSPKAPRLKKFNRDWFFQSEID